jgi:hypothetical protein
MVSFRDGEGKGVLGSFRLERKCSSDMMLALQYLTYKA